MKTTVNQNRKTALQAQSRLSVSFSLHRSAALRRRAPLSASLTVEAALVLPLFLFVLLLFSVPFRIMTAERQMQRAAETVCDRAAALASLSTPEAAQYRNSLSSLALAAARAAVSDPNLSELSAERSSFLADGETVRVVLDYSYTLPIPLFRLPAAVARHGGAPGSGKPIRKTASQQTRKRKLSMSAGTRPATIRPPAVTISTTIFAPCLSPKRRLRAMPPAVAITPARSVRAAQAAALST